MRSFFWSVFSCILYFVNRRIQSENRKIRTRKNSLRIWKLFAQRNGKSYVRLLVSIAFLKVTNVSDNVLSDPLNCNLAKNISILFKPVDKGHSSFSSLSIICAAIYVSKNRIRGHPFSTCAEV